MSWMISLVGLFVLTSLTGSIAQMIWFLGRRFLEKFGYLRWCHIGLWVVTWLYLLPITFLGMKWAAEHYYFWGGVLFTPTPTVLLICLVIAILWAFGFMVTGIKLWKDIRDLRKLYRDSMECERWKREYFEKVCHELRISSGKVRLRQSFRVVTPVFTGILYPTVIIPAVQEWNEESLRAILLHELTHYKQKDAWLTILARIVKVIHFFNPFVWWLNKLIDKWSEFTCDSKVYMLAGGVKRYYGVICSMMEAVCERNEGIAAHLAKNRNEVKERILHMKRFDKSKKRPVRAVLAVGLVLFAGSSFTVMAMDGVGDGYRSWYSQTLVETEEGRIVPKVYVEYTDNGPEEGIIVTEGRSDEVERTEDNSIKWTMAGEYLRQTADFYVQAGQTIWIGVYFDPADKAVKAGIIDSTGKRRYIVAKEDASYPFPITSSGTYRVFVENMDSAAVSVNGLYWIQ